MVFYLLKLVITGAIIVIITEIAKINIKLAAVITAMPLVTILSILWMYYEGATNEKISFYLINTLTYIIPTIPMFIFFPYLLSKTNFYYIRYKYYVNWIKCISIKLYIESNKYLTLKI